jgi:hypothetical protein
MNVIDHIDVVDVKTLEYDGVNKCELSKIN